MPSCPCGTVPSVVELKQYAYALELTKAIALRLVQLNTYVRLHGPVVDSSKSALHCNRIQNKIINRSDDDFSMQNISGDD